MGVQEANHGVGQTSGVTQAIARDISSVDKAASQMTESVRQCYHSTVELSNVANQLKRHIATFQFEVVADGR